MVHVKKFTFGPFQENTFLVYDDKKNGIIIDPGCYSSTEQSQLLSFIRDEKLTITQLLNTHCHVDHIAGNRFIFDQFALKPWFHSKEMPIFQNQQLVSDTYGLPCEVSPEPEGFLQENDEIILGEDRLRVIFTPGHSPGHVVFYHQYQNFIINGDVLFHESIGRTDLPLGDHATLLKSIKEKLFSLPSTTKVYCGHGPETMISHEKEHNPFLK